MSKLPSLYRFHFERQGVTFEISKLAYNGAEHTLSKHIKNIQAAEERRTKAAKAQSDAEAAKALSDAEAAKAQSDAEAAKAQGDVEAANAQGDAEAAKAQDDPEADKAQGDAEAANAQGDTEAANAQGDTEAANAQGDTEAAMAQGDTDAAMAQSDAEGAATTDMDTTQSSSEHEPVPVPEPESSTATPVETPSLTPNVTPSPTLDDAAAREASLALTSGIQRVLELMTGWQSIPSQSDQENTMEQQLEATEKEFEATWSQLELTGQTGDCVDLLTKAYTSTIEQLHSLRRVIKLGSRSAIIARKEDKGLGSGNAKEWLFERARIGLDMVQSAGTAVEDGIHQGTSVLADLKRMSGELRGSPEVASKTIKELSQCFGRLGVSGISSFEFLNSGLSQALLEYLTDKKDATYPSQEERVRAFVQEFMVTTLSDTNKATAPLSLLVKKLQEALTRIESFDVEVAQSSLGETRNNSSSSLATQVRLRLSPDEGTEVPAGFQNLVVSIHAIATFRTLDEYLRPRLKPKLSQTDKEATAKHVGDSNNTIGSNGNGDSNSNNNAKSSKDATPKEQVVSTDTKTSRQSSPPMTRRSSRLQKLSHTGSGEKTNGTTKSKVIKSAKDTDSHKLEDLHKETGGQVEEMDCDLDHTTDANNAQSIEASSIDMDSDVKANVTVDTTTKANTDTHPDTSVDTNADANGESNPSHATSDNSNCPEKSETSTHPKKDRGTEDPSTDSSASSSASSSWHIQFSLHGTPISTDMTVYGAIHAYERIHGKGSSQRIQYASTYPIKYKRVESPPPEQSTVHANSSSNSEVDLTFTSQMPKEMPQNADYAPILGLLRVIHGLNDDWRRFYAVDDQIPKSNIQRLEPREFVNSKISAKVNRQLEEPLIVASSCLPDWTVGLVTGFPFLFPFETRYTYLQSTAFGFSRSIMRWQNQQQRGGEQRDDSQTFLGRIQRQKVRISRQKALESAVRVMELYGANQAMLEVEYFEEVGTGLGPTLEFYSLVSKEFCKKSLKLWRDASSESSTEYVLAPYGLYPRPMSHSKGHSDNEEYVLLLMGWMMSALSSQF
jgi:E3 ubiquitin-protein ligase TRIP12